MSPQCGGYYGELQTQSHCPRHSSGLVRCHKLLVHKGEKNYAHQSFVTTPQAGKCAVSTGSYKGTGSYQAPAARKSKSPSFPGSVAVVTNDLCIRRCRASNNVTPVIISDEQPPHHFFNIIICCTCNMCPRAVEQATQATMRENLSSGFRQSEF